MSSNINLEFTFNRNVCDYDQEMDEIIIIL